MADNTSLNGTCIYTNNLFTISFIPFKFAVILLSIVLFAAAVRDWKKLQRQNCLFSCVISTLVSNICYLLLTIWLTVDNYIADDDSAYIVNQSSLTKVIWTLTEALTVSIVFGICANVTSLIYVTIDSVCVVGRTIAKANLDEESQNNKKNKIIRKNRVAMLLIAFSWLIPIIMTAVAVATWNCAFLCKCPSNNYEGEHCPHDKGCSRMWAPLTTGFLLMNVSLWAVQVIILVSLVLKSFLRCYNASNEQNSNQQKSEKNKRYRVTSAPVDEVPPMSQSALPCDDGIPCERQKTMRHAFRLNTRLRFAIMLSALMICCTLPGVICIIVDALTDQVSTTALLLPPGIFLYIYIALCPALMWKFLPSLKTSVRELFQSCERKGRQRSRSPTK